VEACFTIILGEVEGILGGCHERGGSVGVRSFGGGKAIGVTLERMRGELRQGENSVNRGTKL